MGRGVSGGGGDWGGVGRWRGLELGGWVMEGIGVERVGWGGGASKVGRTFKVVMKTNDLVTSNQFSI